MKSRILCISAFLKPLTNQVHRMSLNCHLFNGRRLLNDSFSVIFYLSTFKLTRKKKVHKKDTSASEATGFQSKVCGTVLGSGKYLPPHFKSKIKQS